MNSIARYSILYEVLDLNGASLTIFLFLFMHHFTFGLIYIYYFFFIGIHVVCREEVGLAVCSLVNVITSTLNVFMKLLLNINFLNF